MNFKTRLATAIATGAVLLNALAPATFAYSLTISGNGDGSVNDATVSVSNTASVTQNNDADVDNNIDVDANTGDNEANDNVGGDVKVETGNATANVTAKTAVNVNQAAVNNCCVGDATVNISGNGPDSDNDVDLTLDNSVDVDQDNDADVDNDVDVDADTGDNEANGNVGGSVKIDTGDTNSTVKLSTAANANSAVVGGGDEEGGTVSAWITGNGEDSDNTIDLDLDNDVVVDQDNDADVENDVEVDGDTGDNEANDNVGGDVEILTGDADATVTVDTLVNFNGADVDGCGCLEDLEAKIAGNGPDSDNDITFDADSDLDVDQDNDADVDNDVDVDGDTGDNEANDNVGKVDAASDPSVDTGDSETTVGAHTAANANVFGGDLDFEWDWDDLLDFLGL